MSLGLDQGTIPEGMRAFISADGQRIEVGNMQISTVDFCQLVIYVLTDTDLKGNDPRFHLMNQIAKLNLTHGHNPGGVRFG